MSGETKRLYFEDPYRIEFEAKVVERAALGGKQALVLDQTCFYPESGGQPSDKGVLNGIDVLQVVEEEDRIFHVLAADISSDKVKGKLDWETRFDHMQQHAGQHILSQCFDRLYEAKTLSFHLGGKASTVEVDLPKISEEDINRAEQLANDTVFQNREIKTFFLQEEEVGGVALRKPPQKKGKIRIVEVRGFDSIACGGTHPRRTGEIGLIKILRWEKIRGNVRLEFVCGRRALWDYTQKHRDLRYLSNQLTVDESEVIGSFEKLSADLKEQKKTCKKIKQKLIQYEAKEIIEEAEEGIIKRVYSDRAPDEVRSLAITIINEGKFVVLFGLKGEARIHMLFACSENTGLDMRELLPVVSPFINGRGGGRPSLVEMAGDKKENLSMALEKAYERVKKTGFYS
jgi:alanyl-tRNA synthetase